MDFDVFDKFCKFSLQLYDKQRDSPPLARNMPPVAGRIGWARHLYKKIEAPISYIKVSLNVSQEKQLKIHCYPTEMF